MSFDITSDPVDFLIAGGGSGGCVLASRLSEDPGTRVLLVEAGRDLTPDVFPAWLSAAYPGRAYFNPSWLWPTLKAARGDTGANRPGVARFYEQARILGGGSSINGLSANRGSPQDYEEWEQAGATGWGWPQVLPYFRKLESDRDYAGPLHGKDGPLPIRRHRPDDWTSYTRAVAASFEEMGYPMQEDQNGPWADGIFPTACNLDDAGRRASVAVAYLTPQVRRRPNLRIVTDTVVNALILDGRQVAGALLTRNGVTSPVAARQVILCLGALQSPVMLMRNGIGPGAHLQERGIRVRADRAGVGENLREHPNVFFSAFLGASARMPPGENHHLQALLRYSSGMPGTPPGDMHIAISARAGWHAVGRRIGGLGVWVNKVYSRGRIRLAEQPDAPAEIDFRLLSDPRDMARLKAGFRLGVRALTGPMVANVVKYVAAGGFSSRIRALSRPSALNAMAMGIAAPIMDHSSALRHRFLAYAMASDRPAIELAADDASLEAHLRQSVAGTYHACGACRMGAVEDRMTVTDEAARVLGVAGLRVCDASIMPTIPCANLNVPVLMMAEKIADTIRRDRAA